MNGSLDYSALDQAAARLGCRVLRDEPLAPRTTFKIGGPAGRLVIAEDGEQLSGILKTLAQLELPWFVLGRGSNLLVGDRGYPGAVIVLEGEFESVKLMEGGAVLRAGAGMSLASVCLFARDNGLTGLEFAWGIPGSIGGAVYMNAGAYGGEIKDVAVKASHIDSMGAPGEYSGDELGFSYRRSAYTGANKVIAWAELRLDRGDREEIAARMEELMSRRKEKQPYNMPSGGSAFKRPAGGYAAELIERCGLKGLRVGGAQVSEKHSGFIVNTGGATCRDVLELMERVRKEVAARTGIELEPELRVVGEL